MLRSLLAALLLVLPGAALAAPAAPVTFAGIDYSKAQMIGTEDFRDPDAIFPGMLNAWNQLWADEMMGDLQGAVGPVTLDNTSVFANNAKAKPDQIVAKDGGQEMVDDSHVRPEDLAALVKGYELKATEGLGLVLVVDRLVKLQETGCTWLVWFDVSSRSITTTKRVCEKASGFGFRNYWFRPIKDTVRDIKKSKPKP